MARFADAFALGDDLTRAAKEATEAAIAQLDGPATLVFAFVSGDDPLAAGFAGEQVARSAAPAPVIGCTGTGVMGAGRGAEGVGGVSVLAGSIPDLRLRTFHLEVIRTPEGMAVVGLPNARADDTAMVLFADPHSFPVDGFVERSNDSLKGLPLVGGLAAGSRGPGSTRLFVDGHVVDRGAVGMLLGGNVRAHAVVSQGCRPVGPPMVVTKANENLILELAGMPAVAKLEQIIADLTPLDQALASSGLQFGVAMDEYAEEHEHGDFLIRSMISIDHESQGIVVGGLVEVGRTVRFQVRDAETAESDLASTLLRLRAEHSKSVIDGALLVSCNGRGQRLYGGSHHDVRAVRDGLGGVPVAGFFAGGEIGPVAARNFLHGFTASVLTFTH